MKDILIGVCAALGICVSSLAISCRGPLVDDVNTSKGRSANDWIQRLPDDIDWNTWHEPLLPSHWLVVPDSSELKAETLLRTAAAVPLNDAESRQTRSRENRERNSISGPSSRFGAGRKGFRG